jgi:hypothetical protein
MIEALNSSETSVLTRATRRNIPEDGILHSHRRENLKSYIALTAWSPKRRRIVSPVRYELGFYIPEDGILRSHHCENLKSYIALTSRSLKRRRNVPLVRYELGFYIPGDDILHSYRSENLKAYKVIVSLFWAVLRTWKNFCCSDTGEWLELIDGMLRMSLKSRA